MSSLVVYPPRLAAARAEFSCSGDGGVCKKIALIGGIFGSKGSGVDGGY
jgi:hypothetical protein